MTNDKKTQARGTVRIFLSSKYDENGKEWKFKEQRRQMTEMDRFTVNCKLFYPICLKIRKQNSNCICFYVLQYILVIT